MTTDTQVELLRLPGDDLPQFLAKGRCASTCHGSLGLLIVVATWWQEKPEQIPGPRPWESVLHTSFIPCKPAPRALMSCARPPPQVCSKMPCLGYDCQDLTVLSGSPRILLMEMRAC